MYGKIVGISLALGLAGGLVGSAVINKITDTTSQSASGSSIVTQSEVIKEKIFTSAITDVAKETSPSVVSIVVTKELSRYRTNPNDFFSNDPFFNQFFGNDDIFTPNQPRRSQPQVETEKQQVAGGTGFVVTQDGKIITNKHVVSIPGAEYTVLFNDGTEYPATILSRDPSNDIAILQLQAKDGQKPTNLKPLKLADQQEVQVGQIVVAIGNALGEFENSVTMGVISAKGRKIIADDNTQDGESLSNLIQTDAAINPGNSGGPLLTLDGEVIGLNTAIAQGATGIGFAIPVSEVAAVLKSVNTYGKIVRPFLGVIYKENSPEIAKIFNLSVNYGAIIQSDSGTSSNKSIVKDGPADKAGIIPGDIILEINGQKLDQNHELKDIITQFAPDQDITIKILRGAAEMDKKVTLGRREDTSTDLGAASPNTQKEAAYLGINGKTLTKELKDTFRLQADNGVILYNDFDTNTPAIAQDSPLKSAGFMPNDVITAVDGTALKTVEELNRMIDAKKAGDKVKITVNRIGTNIEKEVTLGKVN